MSFLNEEEYWPCLHDPDSDWTDPQTIERHGQSMLHWALNTGNLIAFLGSGASMSYGRISWTDLALTHAEVLYSFLNTQNRPSDAEKFEEQLDFHRTALASGNGDQQLLLDLCEQVWITLDEQSIESLAEKQFGIDKAYLTEAKKLGKHAFALACFQEAIKQETVDERAHVRHILRGELGCAKEDDKSNKGDKGKKDDKWADCDLIDHIKALESAGSAVDWLKVFEEIWTPSPLDRAALPEERPHLAFFRCGTLVRIKNAIDQSVWQHGRSTQPSCMTELLTHAANIIDLMKKAAEPRGKDKTDAVHPTLYYALSLALDLIRMHDRQCDGADVMCSVVNAMVSQPPSRNGGRAAFVDPGRDPINTLAKKLHIRRFATTNYDLELERYLKDFSFEPQTTSTSALRDGRERFGALGERARDIALDGVGAADLIGFSLSSDEYVMQVVHLHGRATRDSRIVVTERDYRDIYIDRTRSAETYRQGLSILFGGNPVLFLGVGLSEADLLRPLRELLALASDTNPPVLALMQAQYEPTNCDAKTLAAGNRHRICILHYGVDGFCSDSREKLYQCLKRIEIIKETIKLATKSGTCSIRPEDFALNHDDPCLTGLTRHIAEIAMKVLPKLNSKSRELLEKVLLTAAMRTETAIKTNAFNKSLGKLVDMNGKRRQAEEEIPEDRGLYIRYLRIVSSGLPAAECRTWVRHFSCMSNHGPRQDLVSDFLKRRGRKVCGRKILIVSGGVGAGKGSIFSSLILTMAEQAKDEALYKAHFFAGFSFSCEVASVWDALIDFLNWPDQFGEPRIKLVDKFPLPHAGPGYREMRRLDRLAAALEFASKRNPRERLLIGFNAFDMLFHANGDAKNGEIHEVMRLLFSMSNQAPIDFVIMVRDSRLPYFIKEQADTLPPASAADHGAAPANSHRQRYGRLIADLHVTGFESDSALESSAALAGANVLLRLGDRRSRKAGPAPVHSYGQLLLENLTKGDSGSAAPPTEGEDGAPLPLHQILDRVFDAWEGRVTKKPEEDPFLHEALIRHLAVISIPVRATVLARCPQVQALLERAWKHSVRRAGAEKKSAIIVAKALDYLARNRLILKIDTGPNDKVMDGLSYYQKRYQVHRSVQYHVYRKLGSQVMEPVEFLYFTPTLYGSQAGSLPQLHANAYVFLYELVDELTEYAKPPGKSAQTGSSSLSAKVRSPSLRASLGIVRTLLSLGIVSRLGDTSALPLRTRGIGCLAHHKLVLRWMLHAAAQLGDKPKKLVEVPPPFYADETVWLLNEVGVFALAQGCCREAESYFAQAIKANHTAEGRPGGSMYRRVLLNRGLCAMYMGQLEEARQMFREVQDAQDEELLLRALAQGYRGQVEHLAGRYGEADMLFLKALEDLDALHHLRPASQLRRYRANMLCKMGRTEDARRELNAAVQAAEAGGFSDFIHLAQVSEARLRSAGGAGLAELLPGLDLAEAYADRMDMPQLKVDLLRIRAEIFLSQGETRLPRDLVTEALRIANLNDLVLKRISGTELLSRIYRAQGDLEGANRLLTAARRAARSCGYHLSAAAKGPGTAV